MFQVAVSSNSFLFFFFSVIDLAIHMTGERGNTWKSFLVMNPHLANGSLYLHYYTKQLMLHSPLSRTEVVLPDKLPLPSLLSDVSQHSAQPGVRAIVLRDALPVESFLASVQQGSMSNWGHEAYIRVIFELLLMHGRRAGKDVIFKHLQAVEKNNFHLTLAYFWIQFVQLALTRAGVDVSTPLPAGDLRRPHLEDLALLRDSFLYKEYYSDEALFGQASKGNSEFVPPDKKSFPVN